MVSREGRRIHAPGGVSTNVRERQHGRRLHQVTDNSDGTRGRHARLRLCLVYRSELRPDHRRPQTCGFTRRLAPARACARRGGGVIATGTFAGPLRDCPDLQIHK